MVQHRFELVGPNAGKTVVLGGYVFEEGIHTHESAYEQEPGLTTYLARSYNAHPVGSKALEDAKAVFAGKAKEPDNGPTLDISLAEAIQRLDPAKDDHWTAQGLPEMQAVNKIYGKNVSRADVEKAAPGFTRTVAQQAAKALG